MASLIDLDNVQNLDEVELVRAATALQNIQEQLPELPVMFSSLKDETQSFHLKYCTKLDPKVTLKIFEIFENNMRVHYEETWGWNRNEKMKELFHPAARFIVVTNAKGVETNLQYNSVDIPIDPSEIVAFTIYRFDWDDEDEPEHPVLYCYELQVLNSFQAHGLGRLLMSQLVTIAERLRMWKVMLTCFKRNEGAISFYRRCGFDIDSNSPSSFGNVDEDYEILSNRPTLR